MILGVDLEIILTIWYFLIFILFHRLESYGNQIIL
jgi:hypothetical protein